MVKDPPSSWFVKDCLDFIANCKSLCRLTSRTRKNKAPDHTSSLCIPFLRACFISKTTISKPEQINSNCSVIITRGPSTLSQLGEESAPPHLMRFAFVPTVSFLSRHHRKHHYLSSNPLHAKLAVAHNTLVFWNSSVCLFTMFSRTQCTRWEKMRSLKSQHFRSGPFVTWDCKDYRRGLLANTET